MKANLPMHVLVVHESYRQRGGEDRVVESEVALLRRHGHQVTLLTRDNAELDRIGPLPLLRQTFWSRQTTDEFARLQTLQPIDVVHVHNTVPLVSPSIYWAAARHRIPVVQTLHNFRLICPQAMFLREGRTCEDCLGKVPWRGAVRGCYRGSVADSTVIAGMLTFHRRIGTWQRRIHRYIALNDFSRSKFIDGGLPADRIVVKPNFVLDVDGHEEPSERKGFLYVGRLSPEKGVSTLAKAFASPESPSLRIVGTGPEKELIARISPKAKLLGELDAAMVRSEMRSAMALVLPSICYENFPMVLVEAFAVGLPVIASRIGALAETVDDGVTGMLFEPGNQEQLVKCLQWAEAHPEELLRMGQAARTRFLSDYAAPANYSRLMDIYGEARAAVVTS